MTSLDIFLDHNVDQLIAVDDHVGCLGKLPKVKLDFFHVDVLLKRSQRLTVCSNFLEPVLLLLGQPELLFSASQ